MQYMTLVGADDVRSGGHAVSSAAREMKEAASTIDYAFYQHRMTFGETVQQFANAVALQAEIEGMKAHNAAIDVKCPTYFSKVEFDEAMRRWGFKE